MSLQIKAISAYQLPPRRLLNSIIGGLTVLEAFLLSVWIVLHAVMFWNWYTTYTKGYDYGKQHDMSDWLEQCASCSLATSLPGCF